MASASPAHSVSNEKASTDHRDVDRKFDDKPITTTHDPNDRDAEFGGTEARKALEKKLLRKVDLRMSILIFIYILNYVSDSLVISRSRSSVVWCEPSAYFLSHTPLRSTEITLGKFHDSLQREVSINLVANTERRV